MTSFVVVLCGKNKGAVGIIPGELHAVPDRQTKRMVKFPGKVHPFDYVTCLISNLREATELEAICAGLK